MIFFFITGLLLALPSASLARCDPFIDHILAEEEKGEERAQRMAKRCVSYRECPPERPSATDLLWKRVERRFRRGSARSEEERGHSLCLDSRDPPEEGSACDQ